MSFPDPSPTGGRWVWLSHALTTNTPAYGGAAGLSLRAEKSIARGDTCNALHMAFSNHLGSHVDAPRHFVADGKTVTDYAPETWMFRQPLLLDLSADSADLVTVATIAAACSGADANTDLVLLRTGMERLRDADAYWRDAPGFSAALAPWLHARFPGLAAIGIDALSISSLRYRDEGRLAHRAFLGRGLRIFEDLALGALPASAALAYVIALPLRIAAADGAPCSVIGYVQ